MTIPLPSEARIGGGDLFNPLLFNYIMDEIIMKNKEKRGYREFDTIAKI